MGLRVEYEEGSNKKGTKNNISKLNSLILYSNFSFLIRTRLANAYGTFQSHYVWRKHLRLNNTKTSTMNNGSWLSTDVQSRIDPPLVPLIKVELD